MYWITFCTGIPNFSYLDLLKVVKTVSPANLSVFKVGFMY